MIQRSNVVVTCNSAGAGIATGNATTRQPVCGMVLGVYFDSDPSGPATVDLNVKEANIPSPKTVLNKLNVNTDQWFQSRDPIHLASDGSVIAGGSSPIFVNDNLIVTIAQANNQQVFNVSVQWDDMK